MTDDPYGLEPIRADIDARHQKGCSLKTWRRTPCSGCGPQTDEFTTAHEAHVEARHSFWPGQQEYSQWCCFEAGMRYAQEIAERNAHA